MKKQSGMQFLFVNFAYINTQSNYDKEYITQAGELRVLSQRIAKNATEAAAGKAEAFALLKDARNDFETRWGYLVDGDAENGIPPAPESLSAEMSAVAEDWESLRDNAGSIVDSEQTVLSLHEVAATLAETIPQLQVEYEEVVDILLQSGAPAAQVSVAQRQSLLAERIIGSANKVLVGDEDSVLAADMFGRDASLFGRVLTAMLEGNEAMEIAKVTDEEALERLTEIAELFQFVTSSVDEILENSPELFQVREAANGIFTVSQTLLDKASVLAQGFETRAESRVINTLLGYVLGALALASIILIGLVSMRETRVRLAETAEKNERNQTAILRLLDEIGDLADGDLTAEATVTEDFTGAIADSINFTIEQLPKKRSQLRCTWQKHLSTRHKKLLEHQRRLTKWLCRLTKYLLTPPNHPRLLSGRYRSLTKVTKLYTILLLVWTAFVSRFKTPRSVLNVSVSHRKRLVTS